MTGKREVSYETETVKVPVKEKRSEGNPKVSLQWSQLLYITRVERDTQIRKWISSRIIDKQKTIFR